MKSKMWSGEDLPPKCPVCGRFMKVKSWAGENDNECEEYSCVCGHELG